jgi:hypothetical protein
LTPAPEEEVTVSSYRVTLKDRSTEEIDDVDAYQQEGQMTTFFRTGSDRQVVDTWSTRMASFRTSEIIAIRRLESVATASMAPVADLRSA